MQKLPIIYQDDDIVVVDKPAGIATHAATSWTGADVVTLLDEMQVTIDTEGDSHRHGVVSRLDVGTSGVMVLARNQDAFENLKTQFAAHTTEKIYHALAYGNFVVKHGTLNAPIGRHPKHRALFAVVENGKPAVTHFDALEQYHFEVGKDKFLTTYLQIRLETGRTHQIRVHLNAYHHPLVGDSMYGKATTLEKTLHEQFDFQRPFLHSSSLKITHPKTGKILHFESPLHETLKKVLNYAKK
jgi:23S rRNA pseudouridine1911/1915/1917 synthase